MAETAGVCGGVGWADGGHGEHRSDSEWIPAQRGWNDACDDEDSAADGAAVDAGGAETGAILLDRDPPLSEPTFVYLRMGTLIVSPSNCRTRAV